MRRLLSILLVGWLVCAHAWGEIQTTIPIVKLQYDALSKDTFSPGQFAFICDNDTLRLPMGVRHRGATSTRYQKKSYAVKLYDGNGVKKDTSLFGMRSDNYWILDAMATDKARMRNRVAMDLWLDFSAKPYYQSSEPNLCNGYHGKFVEIYVNDDYQGIYCLMERVDRKQLKIKKFKNTIINGILYKSVSWDGSFFGDLTPFDNNSPTWMRYEYEYPDVEDNLINWSPLYDAMDFVNTASSEDFVNGAPARYDIPVFLDYYLFTALLSARDNRGKNLYLSYYNINQNSKLLVTPWDIDHSFGRMYNSDEEVPETVFRFSGNFYERLMNEMPEFYTQMQARYASLRKNAFSLESLRKRFTDYFKLFASTQAAERETAKWNDVDNISLDFPYEEEYILSWLEQRLVYIDSLFLHENTSQKILRNGQILILHREKMYTVTGQEVK